MGSTWQETNLFLDELTDLAAELQVQTGVKLLWATCNLFAHPNYANGASTNPDAHVFAMAAAQVKKGLEVAKKLGAEGFGELLNFVVSCLHYVNCAHVVFWGGREGYQSLLNTDVKRELDHMATFFRMAVGRCLTAVSSVQVSCASIYCSIQAEDRVHWATADRAKAKGTYEASV